jgi:hypothetical protein
LQIVAGCNVQIAVDDEHELIVAGAVVDDGNDTGQLHAMAQAAKDALGAAALTVVADSGDDNGETLKACEEPAITACVPSPDRSHRLKAQGRFGLQDFQYDAAAGLYRCPGIAVRAAPSCGRCAVCSGKPPARWRSAMPAGDRFAGPVCCASDASRATARGARSSAGFTRTGSSAIGCASRSMAET